MSILIGQMIVLTKTFKPYEQFDLDIILKVMAAFYNMILADFNCITNLPQAINQAVLGVLFASIEFTNMA